VKAIGQLVEDTATSHGLQGFHGHVPGFLIAAPGPISQEEGDAVRGGELGRPAETAITPVVIIQKGLEGTYQYFIPQVASGCGPLLFA